MTNKERAFAIVCLDTGRHMTETVAQQFHMSVEELETELAIFRCSSIYVKQYATYVERQKKELLKDCSFTPWRDNFTMRQLPNKRIECIVRDENTKLPFLYHAYLPGKDYLDHINERSSWVGNDAFNYVITYEQIGLWQSRAVDTQLRFLVMRFDAATFLPFRRTINYLEYERITGVPFPENPDDSKSKVLTPVFKTPPFLSQKIEEANERAAKCQLGEFLARSEVKFQRDDDWVDHLITDREREAASELIEMPDLDRLKRLAEDGPCQEEWDLLRYIDGFYKKWGLLELMRTAETAGNLTAFKMQVRAIWEQAKAESTKESEVVEPQVFRKKSPWQDNSMFGSVEMVQGIESHRMSDDEENDEDDEENADERVEIQRILEELEGITNPMECRRDLQLMEKFLRRQKPQAVERIVQDYRRKVSPNLHPKIRSAVEVYLNRCLAASSRVENTEESAESYVMGESIASHTVPETAPVSEPVAPVVEEPPVAPTKPTLGDVMNRRRTLLSQLRAGLDPDLLRELQMTENELLALPIAAQPAGFPERDTLLLYLYSVAKIKTGSGMTQRVMVQLSDDEVNEFLALQKKGLR